MPSSSPAAMAAADRAAAALDRLARLHPKLIDLGLDRSFAFWKSLAIRIIICRQQSMSLARMAKARQLRF